MQLLESTCVCLLDKGYPGKLLEVFKVSGTQLIIKYILYLAAVLAIKCNNSFKAKALFSYC